MRGLQICKPLFFVNRRPSTVSGLSEPEKLVFLPYEPTPEVGSSGRLQTVPRK